MKPENKLCESIKFRLAEQGLRLLSEDISIQEHIGDCQECFEFLGALEAVDSGLEELPQHEPSQQLLETTLAKIRQTPKIESTSIAATVLERFNVERLQSLATKVQSASAYCRSLLQPRFAAVTVGLFALLISVRIVQNSASVLFTDNLVPFGEPSEGGTGKVGVDEQYKDLTVSYGARLEQGKNRGEELSAELERTSSDFKEHKERVAGIFETLVDKFESLSREVDSLASASRGPIDSSSENYSTDSDFVDHWRKSQKPEPKKIPPPLESSQKRIFAHAQTAATRQDAGISAEQGDVGGKEELSIDDEVLATAMAAYSPTKRLKGNLIDKNRRDDYLDEARTLRGTGYFTMGFLDETLGAGLRKDFDLQSPFNESLKRKNKPESADLPSFNESGAEQTSFRSLNNLRFVEAAGYWANTYVPGDPAIRRLQTTLRNAQPDANTQQSQTSAMRLDFHTLAHYPQQPFDVPANAALGLQLATDRTGLDGPGRMLVQVGIRGTDRNAGRRPALNVAIVLDVTSSVSPKAQAELVELLLAFNAAKDVGDRFRLFTVGSKKVIGAEDFRHGPLSLAVKEALSNSSPQNLGAKTLQQVYADALKSVRSDDNPNAPLGSSSVILVSDRAPGGAAESLVNTAHVSAVDGIQTSVIAFGDNSDVSTWEEVALSGQGSRHIFRAGSSAAKIVEKEVSSVSRTVARAVRLRIRLLPGVKLVNVIGSYRLDEVRAEQVREAEKSVDRRIAHTLGLQADRGEDEEGIQIVIPAFYAGDSHVVLLDVVAPGAGAIADVRVRYKDLVHLKNAVATANLSLGRTISSLGPLEQNVLKNFLAFNLSTELAATSAEIRYTGAMPEFGAKYRALLAEILTLAPELSRDREVRADLELLTQYASAVNQFASTNRQMSNLVADSLALASKQKVLPIKLAASNE